MTEISENLKSEQQWLRGLFMLLFLIVFEIVELIIIAVTVIQFLFAIINGAGNTNLVRFGSSLSQYAAQLVNFLTYNTNEKPFPFAEWPEPEKTPQPDMEFGSSTSDDTQSVGSDEAESPPVDDSTSQEAGDLEDRGKDNNEEETKKTTE